LPLILPKQKIPQVHTHTKPNSDPNFTLVITMPSTTTLTASYSSFADKDTTITLTPKGSVSQSTTDRITEAQREVNADLAELVRRYGRAQPSKPGVKSMIEDRLAQHSDDDVTLKLEGVPVRRRAV
jgi:hypothetical protein